MSRAVSLSTGPSLVLSRGAFPLSTRVGTAWGFFPLGAAAAPLVALPFAAPEEEAAVEACLAGAFGGLAREAASESPTFEMLSASLHSFRNWSKEGSRVPP